MYTSLQIPQHDEDDEQEYEEEGDAQSEDFDDEEDEEAAGGSIAAGNAALQCNLVTQISKRLARACCSDEREKTPSLHCFCKSAFETCQCGLQSSTAACKIKECGLELSSWRLCTAVHNIHKRKRPDEEEEEDEDEDDEEEEEEEYADEDE